MTPFDYVRPATVAEAVAAASSPGAAVLAGGTNLLDLMKVGVAHPSTIVDISSLPDLNGIEATDDGGMRVGAMVRNADLAQHPEFAAAFPAVAEALLSGASAQLRNAATVGGNLLQSTRCPYFFDPLSACNRRQPGAGCDAVGGVTGGHAILGWAESCIATFPSDFCVPLAALEAEVEIQGPAGQRLVSLDAVYGLPSDTEAGGPKLAQGELIVALHLPAEASSFAGHARYLKLRERTSYAFALVSVAAMLRLEGGAIAEARIALGGVAAMPWRARAAEDELTGSAPNAPSFARAAEAALADARPSGNNAHKIDAARRLVARALAAAAQGTPHVAPAMPGSVFAAPRVDETSPTPL